ncbi:MAG: cyclodeaminase/cyclohydrolase family protein [Phycisphaerales bacterium]|nr:MAG: cyclodeaminase/cyclohydrolase family protein [Phycisphaerales bacterium]
MEVMKAMAEFGLEASASDAGVGALCARTAVMGAFLNVKINCPGMQDKTWVEKTLAEGREIEQNAIKLEGKILQIVNGKI